MAGVLLSLPAVTLAQQIAIGAYPIPTASSAAYEITAGPDGALWFTEQAANKIGRITGAGAITQYPVTMTPSEPSGISEGPDGALWFTDAYHNIGRITTTGAITEYPLPSPDGPNEITVGPDGALWFTELNAGVSGGTNGIGRITTAGAITEYPVPSANSLSGITAGPDGALWFTETYGTAKIGRITTTGVVTEYLVPTTGAGAYGITAGPDGALWFTELYGSAIGRITTAGIITEYPTPTTNSGPTAITVGPDGALWFTENSGNKIARITTGGMTTEYPLPNAGGGMYGITSGPDGQLWFTEGSSNAIGQALFVTGGLVVTPATGVFQTNLTFTGSKFRPNEKVKIYVSGVGSTALATPTASATGSFTISAKAPQSPYGPRLFLGGGQTSGKIGAASFYVNPKLILNPTSGAVGSIVTAQAYGFGSFENVQVYLRNPRVLLTTATANVAGALNATFTVPTAPSGANTIFGTGETTGAHAAAAFTVQ